MKYAKLMHNDTVNGEGICVSLWTQGCPFKCHECHNPETWDENGGFEIPINFKEQIIAAIGKNRVQRNFSILGGEPLAIWNLEFVQDIVFAVRKTYPNIKIYLWTGYILKDLIAQNNPVVNSILDKIDVLIDGPFIQEKKDLTLKFRGSSNQKIWIKTECGWKEEK